MYNKVKNVCIVGGGSAGWLTALWCVRTMPHIKLTIVESPNIPRVGVGEATLVAFDAFLRDCGINESEFMLNSDGVYKSGILFPDWGVHNHPVWHPFSFHTPDEDKSISRFELFYNSGLLPKEFFKYAFRHEDTSVKHNKVPPAVQQQTGYHVDCVKLANYIPTLIKKYITHYQETVIDVVVKDENIKEVILDSGKSVTADLFIDCTGFKRLLSNKLLGSKWINKDHMLFNNAAVAGHISYTDVNTEMKPYTECQAVEWGWIWKIPIDGRIGSGMVYDDNLISKENAEQYFRNYWGNDRIIESHPINHIQFKPEYNANNWRGNCLSIGLASGFIEPLESTGLFLLTEGIRSATDKFRKGYYNQADRDGFNAEMTIRYDESMDFVALHYVNAKAAGPFWDKVRAEFTPSDSLELAIETYKTQIVEWNHNQHSHNFMHLNWHLWLYSVGIQPAYNYIEKNTARKVLEDLYKKTEKYLHLQCFTNKQLIDIRKDLHLS
jgi:tryptophan halogenase